MTDKELYGQRKIASGTTDEELYGLCKKFGKMALESRRKFAGLLPEVFRRKLYEKKGFSSIFEFAAKLSGMSKEQVSLVMKLEKKFEDKPVLREALVTGEISANKLVRVVSIATAENQEDLFNTIKVLSNRAVEVLVRDVKNERNVIVEDAQNKPEIGVVPEISNGFQKLLFDAKSMHVHGLNLAEDVEKELFEMQGRGIDINEFLRNVLKKRKEEIGEKKEELAEEQNDKNNRVEIKSRYIPAKVRKIIREEHGDKCSYPLCTRQAKILHHTRRFALTCLHDPHFIAPLCDAHHEIAHKIDVKFAEKS